MISSRFLRARRFIPQDALGQFKDTEKWREVNQLDKLYMNIDVENFEEARRLVSAQSLYRRGQSTLTLDY